MAFNDTLFQLGMDLTRSSPAQKEEYGEVAHVARKQTTDERASGRFAGTKTQAMDTHLTIDVYGITGLDSLEHVETTLTRCVEAAGSTLQHLHLQSVPATGGVSGVAVLSDGHISLHSRPLAGYAALDIATTGACEMQRWVAAARAAFGKCQIVSRVHASGGETVPVGPSGGVILHAVMPQRRQRTSMKPLRVKAA
jgi:S-adenosylmethionine decarboxylase